MINKPFTEAQMRERARQALGSLALEGMHPAKETLADIELMVTGKITANEFISRGIKRAKNNYT